MSARQELGPVSAGLDAAGECLRFVVTNLFGEGVECPGTNRCPGSACGKVAALHAFAARKFAAEEEAMQRLGYDELDAHEDDHRRFLGRLKAITPSRRCDDTLRHLKDLVDEWMRSHLDTFDGAFNQWAARAVSVEAIAT